MANKKQPYSWGKVKPGDIISFRYKSKSTGKAHTNSILVLNPKLNVTLKDGKSTKHLIGIKLEESNKISLRLNQKQVMAVINFEPKQVGPIMSECLVLGFYRKNNSVVLATNDLPIENGSRLL